MGAKLIPHLLAKREPNAVAAQPELLMIPFDGEGPIVQEPLLTPEFVFNAGSPRESQGPAKLLVSDQMESLLGWYV